MTDLSFMGVVAVAVYGFVFGLAFSLAQIVLGRRVVR